MRTPGGRGTKGGKKSIVFLPPKRKNKKTIAQCYLHLYKEKCAAYATAEWTKYLAENPENPQGTIWVNFHNRKVEELFALETAEVQKEVKSWREEHIRSIEKQFEEESSLQEDISMISEGDAEGMEAKRFAALRKRAG